MVAQDHVYNSAGTCFDVPCLSQRYDSIEAANYPVVISEFGEYDCGSSFMAGLWNMFDQHNVGYLGYDWGPFLFCSNGLLSLLTQFNPPRIFQLPARPIVHCRPLCRRLIHEARTGTDAIPEFSFAVATRIVAQTSGTATISVQPAQTPNSLLAGKTPATFTSLAGWTTVAKEDFRERKL